jgi:hypothetical protein
VAEMVAALAGRGEKTGSGRSSGLEAGVRNSSSSSSSSSWSWWRWLNKTKVTFIFHFRKYRVEKIRCLYYTSKLNRGAPLHFGKLKISLLNPFNDID